MIILGRPLGVAHIGQADLCNAGLLTGDRAAFLQGIPHRHDPVLIQLLPLPIGGVIFLHRPGPAVALVAQVHQEGGGIGHIMHGIEGFVQII